jgi:hypothetical protein
VHLTAAVQAAERLFYDGAPKVAWNSSVVAISEFATSPSDTSIESAYKVSPQGAEILWQYSQWYLLSKRDLLKAIDQAQKVLAGCEAWELEFPGVAVGDRQALWNAFKWNRIGYPGESIGDWVDQVVWKLPAFIVRPVEVQLAERELKLREAAEAGNEEAMKLIVQESVPMFWNEMIAAIEQRGVSWDRTNNWSDNIPVPEGENTVPVLGVFVNDQQLATYEVWYTRSGGKPYWRLFEKDVLVPNEYPGYRSGSIELREIEQKSSKRDW